MRAFVASVLLFWPLIASAETRSMDHLTKEGFVGTWEAIIQDDSMATGVYQMVVPTKGDATLIQLFAGGKSMFFGRAASWELANGKIKIRFTMDPKHVHYYDWIEIQGSAVGEADAGAIVGKLTKLEFYADPTSPYHRAEFDPQRRIILHCASGGRSALAADTLQQMGYSNVAHLDGGFKAWEAAGQPVTKPH